MSGSYSSKTRSWSLRGMPPVRPARPPRSPPTSPAQYPAEDRMRARGRRGSRFQPHLNMPISLDRNEAIEILEEIARKSQNAAARIAAIKQLEDMRRDEEQVPEGFESLYADDLAI